MQTVVGVNAWVIHRDRNLWGEDVNEFKPERWLVDQKQLSIMEQHFLAVSTARSACRSLGYIANSYSVRRRSQNLYREEHIAPGDDETRSRTRAQIGLRACE